MFEFFKKHWMVIAIAIIVALVVIKFVVPLVLGGGIDLSPTAPSAGSEASAKPSLTEKTAPSGSTATGGDPLDKVIGGIEKTGRLVDSLAGLYNRLNQFPIFGVVDAARGKRPLGAGDLCGGAFAAVFVLISVPLMTKALPSLKKFFQALFNNAVDLAGDSSAKIRGKFDLEKLIGLVVVVVALAYAWGFWKAAERGNPQQYLSQNGLPIGIALGVYGIFTVVLALIPELQQLLGSAGQVAIQSGKFAINAVLILFLLALLIGLGVSPKLGAAFLTPVPGKVGAFLVKSVGSLGQVSATTRIPVILVLDMIILAVVKLRRSGAPFGMGGNFNGPE